MTPNGEGFDSIRDYDSGDAPQNVANTNLRRSISPSFNRNDSPYLELDRDKSRGSSVMSDSSRMRCRICRNCRPPTHKRTFLRPLLYVLVAASIAYAIFQLLIVESGSQYSHDEIFRIRRTIEDLTNGFHHAEEFRKKMQSDFKMIIQNLPKMSIFTDSTPAGTNPVNQIAQSELNDNAGMNLENTKENYVQNELNSNAHVNLGNLQKYSQNYAGTKPQKENDDQNNAGVKFQTKKDDSTNLQNQADEERGDKSHVGTNPQNEIDDQNHADPNLQNKKDSQNYDGTNLQIKKEDSMNLQNQKDEQNNVVQNKKDPGKNHQNPNNVDSNFQNKNTAQNYVMNVQKQEDGQNRAATNLQNKKDNQTYEGTNIQNKKDDRKTLQNNKDGQNYDAMNTQNYAATNLQNQKNGHYHADSNLQNQKDTQNYAGTNLQNQKDGQKFIPNFGNQEGSENYNQNKVNSFSGINLQDRKDVQNYADSNHKDKKNDQINSDMNLPNQNYGQNYYGMNQQYQKDVQSNAPNDQNLKDFQNYVRNELNRYDGDNTLRADFALETTGGRVVATGSTVPYYRYENKLSKILSMILNAICGPKYAAQGILQPSVHPGHCWAFRGSHGEVIIRLYGKVYCTGVTIEHIPAAISPTGDTTSAPKDFTVKGLETENDKIGCSFGSFTYNKKGIPKQYFPIENNCGKPYRFIKINFLTNWGNPVFTCIYRVQVHGKLVEEYVDGKT